ncbi:MAG: glycerophosphodiester phosphodiesterase family protein, partial [Dehalococcoidia bacterium]
MTASQDLGDDLAPVVGGERRVFCCHSANLSRSHPGNSLAAVRECVEARVPRLEVDVRFLADDSMLVFHDGSLDTETSGSGPANAIDGAAARGLRYKGGDEPLAFLEDVVGAMEAGPTRLQVDLKLMRPITEGRARALVGALEPLGGNVIVGTQAHWNLRPLGEAGLPIAFDPTLQINAYPAGREEGMTVP